MEKSSHSNFLIIWLGQLISSIGNGLTAFALGIYVFQKTGSASSYSFVLLAAFLPALLLKPIGGTLSDRIDRRLLMIVGDLGSAAGLVFIIVMMFFGKSDLWIIYLGSVVSSIFVAVQNPSFKASVTDLVDANFYAKASGLMQLAESAKFLISPIVAGFLLKIMDIKELLIIDACTFLIAIVTVFWMRTKISLVQAQSSQHFLSDLKQGFQYIFRNKGIFWLLVIISLVTFFMGLLQALLGPMILSFASPQMLGIIQTIILSGMLVGGVFVSIAANFNKKIPILSVSLALCGLFFSLLGISTRIPFIILFGFLFFLVLPVMNTCLDVLVRTNVANAVQGRVWSIVSLISQLGMAIAFGIAGYLADSIFNPLLMPNGLLASSLGSWIGIGEGRGVGLIFIISGIFVLLIATLISKLKTLKKLDGQESRA